MAAAQPGPSSSTQPSRKSTRAASNAAHAAPGKKAKKGKNSVIKYGSKKD